ncbi:SDR family NAD(P)-dependent oxidoreductase [Mesorhizobium sp. KR9-304]|uniref:SDR family NAD(P)-dependent oxidoreductase n=1 Tax=Mesorhizobium sp. KR9-304 TaxID=3156614 RepID=UPI0032B401A8
MTDVVATTLSAAPMQDDVTLDFRGQTVVLSGGSRGIGLAVAKAFVRSHADLRVLADDPTLTSVVAELATSAKGKVSGRIGDIAESGAATAMLSDIPKIDVLIANAGMERLTPIDDLSAEAEEYFRRVIAVNVIGTYLTVRAAVPKMRSESRIILTSSVWGKSAVGEFGAYIASKHAVIGLMRSLARELGPRGIRVNCVCPGWVRTEAALKSLRQMSERSGIGEADILDEVLTSQCLPGFQAPDDVPGLFVFLASSLSRNITGQAINIDRGEFLG